MRRETPRVWCYNQVIFYLDPISAAFRPGGGVGIGKGSGMPTITCYDGVNTICGNKIILEDGDTRLFFDFSTSFGRRYEFFEDYLKPRPGVGLLDLLYMELLPPLNGIYRQELVPNDELWPGLSASYHYRELAVNGVLLFHAHIDHSGYISFSVTV